MDAIDRIRAFNRAHTRRLGLLDRHYLDDGLSLPQMRVLTEVAAAGEVTARALSRDLALDEGYLSRLVAGLVRAGLVERRGRGRARPLALTTEGVARAGRLAALSRAAIGRWFEGQGPGAAAAAAEALDRAGALLEPGGEIALRDLAVGDAGWLIERHATLYARDEGFDASFEALVAEILAGFIRDREAPDERAFIAHRGAERLGSVFCVRGAEAGEAKLRLFLVVPEARGTGLGRRLLHACIAHARARGFRRLALWTHESHRAACALYARTGFVCTASRPVHSFGQDLVEQEWALDLRA